MALEIWALPNLGNLPSIRHCLPPVSAAATVSYSPSPMHGARGSVESEVRVNSFCTGKQVMLPAPCDNYPVKKQLGMILFLLGVPTRWNSS